MKCQKCGVENKPGAKFCKKCGSALIITPIWKPTWKWHLKTLIIIYVILIVVFFTLNFILKPYMRKLPSDITPWLNHQKTTEKK